MESVEFFYRKFFYDRNTLTPRLETESLVRLAIGESKRHQFDTLIDVGTGSAIIAISIEKNTSINEIYGLEKSALASKVAKENMARHGSKMKILKSELLKAFFENNSPFGFMGKDILFVANLPYIKNGDWGNMSPDTKFEPKMALFGGKGTGFELYKKYYSQLLKFKEAFKPSKIVSVSEIGFDQKDEALFFLDRLGIKATALPDLRGIERFIRFEI